MKSNTHYFQLSMANPEPIWDYMFYDFLEKPVDASEIKNIRAMEVYLATLSSKVSIFQAKVLLDHLSKKGCEKSYFSFALRTCDLSRAELIGEGYYSLTERITALQRAVKTLKTKRSTKISTDLASLQAYNDAQTTKRRSSSGENKVIALSGLEIAHNISDLDGKIAKISKSRGSFTLPSIKTTFKITARVNSEDKSPDCIFKIKEDIFLLEAKHVGGEGGGQNNSLAELIALVNLSDRKGVHFVSFLDGTYTKYLSETKPNPEGTKLEKQKFQLIEALKKNPQNYFLNTTGFRAFISDLRLASARNNAKKP